MLAAVSRIFHDARRNAGRLSKRVVADGHTVAGERKRRKADRDVIADRHTVKGGNAVHKLKHIAVDHAHKCRCAVDLG